MGFNGLKRRFIFHCINMLPKGKFNKIKINLFNKIKGFKISKTSTIVGKIYVDSKTCCISKNVWIGNNFKIEGNGDVIIRNNVDIGPNVTFLTGSHLNGSSKHRAGEGVDLSIDIKDGVWIGANSIILGSTEVRKIMNGSIIACGSVVISDVPPNILVAGNPAKAKKEFVS